MRSSNLQISRIVYNRFEVSGMKVKVKMNVQTSYHGKLLRAGKEYEVDKEVAERWIASRLAEKVKE